METEINMKDELVGKRILVTGAGRGIGRSIAIVLAKAGATLILAARDEHSLEETRSLLSTSYTTHHTCIPFDIGSETSVAQLYSRLVEKFGTLDVLVNNSGIGGPSAPLWEVNIDEWNDTIAVNLTGSFLVCRAFLPLMIAQQSGSIVLIGSMTGKRPLLHRAPYASSKIGIVGLSRTLALDAGPFGVRVNVVSPGFVEGERLEWVIEKQAAARGQSLKLTRNEMAGDSPLGRFVTPEDVANAVLFLSSNQSNGITGMDLNVTAGLTMY